MASRARQALPSTTDCPDTLLFLSSLRPHQPPQHIKHPLEWEHLSLCSFLFLSTLNALPPNSFMAHFLLTQGHHLNLTLSDHLPTFHTSCNSCSPFLFDFVLSNLFFFLTLIYCVFCLGFPLEYKYQVCNELCLLFTIHALYQKQPLAYTMYPINI